MLVLAILGGIGIYFAGKYAKEKVSEGVQQLEQMGVEIEQSGSGSGGLVINEGDDDSGTSGGGDVDVSGGDDAPRAVISLLKGMFTDWADGDMSGVKARMTGELVDGLGDRLDDSFETGYKQVSLDFTIADQISSNEWAFVIEEQFRNFGDDEVYTETYHMLVVKEMGQWLIGDMSNDAEDEEN